MMAGRTLLACWVIILVTAGNGSAEISASHTIDRRLVGCWTAQRSVENSSENSSVRCYRLDGYVTGVTIHAGDGWDWSYRYRAHGTLVLNDRYRVEHNQFQLAGRRLITTDQHGEQLTWSLLCRTKTQDVQCGRLSQKLQQSPGNE
jgi:hypothetical protein